MCHKEAMLQMFHTLRLRETSSGMAAAVFGVTVSMLLVMPFFPRYDAAAAGSFLLLAGVMARQRQNQLAAALLALCLFACLCALQVHWPWPCAGAAVAYEALSRSLNLSCAWRKIGDVSRRTVAAVAASIAIATTVLLTWTALVHPDTAAFRARLPTEAGVGTVLALAILFSSINAAGEELMYRGMLMDALEQAWGRTAWAIAGQAAAFGAIHWHGFPYGGWGVFLATGYGVLMAGLKCMSGGLVASWAAHVLADTVIVILVAFY